MIENNPYQKIYELIEPTLPEGWNRVLLYMEYSDDSFMMKYFVNFLDKGFVDCYDLPDVADDQLTDLFMEIDDILSPARDELKEKWTIATLDISSEGHFNCDFEYIDHEFDVIENFNKWKEKNLKEI